ncbi:NF-kappa-B essential modulator [Condylostylus longicornis]|uniref:NF-kappa-B essential modulator n=1 Tax=Condylostylus longicornis TaxID=2530218 RepID=UPI00244E00A1|nr:NF-kappa-B essential modulator [Condylostylus longicornis]
MADENDEESFVILGTSPTGLSSYKSENSENNFRSNFSSINGITGNELDGNVSDASVAKYSFIDDYQPQISASKSNIEPANSNNWPVLEQNQNLHTSSHNKSEDNSNVRSPSLNHTNSDVTKSTKASFEVEKNNISLDGTRNLPAKEGSLAASFLMGDLHLDVLKATLHSQFPSLCSSSIKSDEFIKLQNVLAEYIELKETLQKNNIAMRKHFTTLQKWQEEVRSQKEEQAKQIETFQGIVTKLRNENLELRKELNDKIEQIKINEDILHRENEEMVKIISSKTAQIQNMAFQIEKLEQQHLNSFEYIEKLKNENELEKDSKKKMEYEYIPILEHKRIVSELETKLSEAVAKNLELDELKDKYLAEIKSLKERLHSCQEELKNAQHDISILKSNDEERKQHFENYQKERDEMRNEISILKTQVEIYSKDFEMERVARENLAGEKEKVLTELRLLQKRNQELLESSKKHFESLENVEKDPSSSRNNNVNNVISDEQRKEEQVFEPSGFVCPLCNRQFKLLHDLQTHVEDCIDNQ